MSRPHILIADDDRDVINLLKGWILEEPWNVAFARDGQEALDLLRTGRFDVAILDLKMPYLDGLEVFEGIQKAGVDTDIVFLTGFGRVDTAVQAIKMGAQDFLEKPVHQDSVIRVIRKLIAHRYPSSHIVADRLNMLLKTTRFDAILLDIKMPEMDGLAVLRRIFEQDPRAFVLMLTAVEDEQVAKEATQLGASGFLLKPCDISLLQLTLEYAWAQRQSE